MEALEDDTLAHFYATLVIGAVTIILLGTGIYLIHVSILRQIGTIRKLYFKSLLSQEKAFYDTALDSNFISKSNE